MRPDESFADGLVKLEHETALRQIVNDKLRKLSPKAKIQKMPDGILCFQFVRALADVAKMGDAIRFQGPLARNIADEA